MFENDLYFINVEENHLTPEQNYSLLETFHPIRITDNGLDNTVFNGIADWLYTGILLFEILCDGQLKFTFKTKDSGNVSNILK